MLALLALLGLLAMHGTPMTAMAAMPAMSAMPAVQAVGDQHVGHGMSRPRTIDAAAPGHDSYAIGVRGAGDRHPQPEHATAPCVSDSARSQAHALAPDDPAVTPVAVARRLESAAAERGARADRSPPDLSELCISRT